LPTLNPLTPELKPCANAACRDFLLGILIFKGLTARRLSKSFGVKGFIILVRKRKGIFFLELFEAWFLHFSLREVLV
jgi:hypothetical protein